MAKCNHPVFITRTGIAILSLTAIVFFCLNFFVPYYDDDVWYALRYIPGETLSPINNFSDILVSQYHHYIGENSRALIHITLQSLLAILPDYAFDIVNTLVFALLLLCMALYIQQGNGKLQPITLLMCIAGIYWLLPDMSYLFYWASGSLNYLWTSVAILSFMLLWQHITHRPKPISIASIAMGLWAFCCGFGHEALSLPVGATLLIYMLVNNRKIGFNQATIVAIAYGLGCVAILVAPGLSNKAQYIEYSSATQFLSDFILTLRHLRVIPLCLFVALIACCRKVWRKELLQFAKRNIYLIITVIVAFLFVVSIGAGELNMRIFYGAEFFALLLLLRFFHTILLTATSRTIKTLTRLLAGLIALWAMVILPLAYRTGTQHKTIFEQYLSDEDGVIFLPQEHTPRIAENWVMDLHHTYYEAPESEWRGFVIPLVGLGDTLSIPTPLTARNSNMSYQLYNQYIQVLPWGTQEAIESPETFFTPTLKVRGNNPFYITRDSAYVIAPLEMLPPHSMWQWHYQPASWRDPSASTLGWIKRIIAPHLLPRTAPMQYADTVALPDGREYVIYVRPPYNTLQSIEPVE